MLPVIQKTIISTILASGILVSPQAAMLTDRSISPSEIGVGGSKVEVVLPSSPEDYLEEICSGEGAKTKECIIGLIEKYSKQYELPKQLALDIAACESNLKPTAVGDGGKAYGIYQFHKPTFSLLSKKMGEKLDYYSIEDNIRLAIWAISTDRGFHWSCYNKLARK
ncbi:MAG: transglycosylase SLT domain-containing protein [Candidatus Paceibacterota bacterium]|jgi:soluble lytic murein transglycosylase-like protein